MNLLPSKNHLKSIIKKGFGVFEKGENLAYGLTDDIKVIERSRVRLQFSQSLNLLNWCPCNLNLMAACA